MLKITLISGQEQDVPFNSTSTVTVTNQGFVDGIATPITASYSEIASLEIVADPEPQVATIQTEDPPAPPVPTSASPDDGTVAGTEPTSSDVLTPIQDDTVTGIPAPVTVTDSGLAVVTGVPNASDAPVDGSGNPVDPAADVTVPAPDPEPDSAPDTSNPQVDAQTTPQSVGEALAAADPTEPTDAPADPPPALTDTIAAAGAVVDAAVTDPSAHVDHLAQAQTDVAAALNTWPDDPNLLDLQGQLADLAADASEAASEPPAAA